jgi:hypothetical protein
MELGWNLDGTWMELGWNLERSAPAINLSELNSLSTTAHINRDERFSFAATTSLSVST